MDKYIRTSPHERLDLIEKYEVTQELLDYAIDPYEKARVEIDPDAGVTLLIFDVYVPTHAVTAPQTAPIGIMLTANNIITFTNAKTNFVNGIIANQLQLLKKTRGKWRQIKPCFSGSLSPFD